MKVTEKSPPREFSVKGRTLRHMADLELAPGELVTFHVGQSEYDVTATAFGYYATPSTNRRLTSFGWRTALVRNPEGAAFVLLVHPERLGEFRRYLAEEDHRILAWLDDDRSLERIENIAGDLSNE